jgi:hypothetical protein
MAAENSQPRISPLVVVPNRVRSDLRASLPSKNRKALVQNPDLSGS